MLQKEGGSGIERACLPGKWASASGFFGLTMTAPDVEPLQPGSSLRSSAKARSRWKWVFLLVVAIVVFVVARRFQVEKQLRVALDWVRQLGPWGVVVFILIFIGAAILFVPGSVLTLGAGAIYGAAWGSVYSSIGGTLGAAAAFLVSRYLLRERLARRFEQNARWAAVDRAVAEDGWKIILLTRLSPVFPYNLSNYGFGLTQVKFRHYFMASWLGMMPAAVMYAYLGSLARTSTASGRSPIEWAFYGLGLAATIGVTIVIGRISRRALSQRLS
jgi:uncharacterized membrane protein YdjX (TVP38/TMEM64 family)